jgi:YbgC/YbaW family acyl-CoA thioester hydrolase
MFEFKTKINFYDCDPAGIMFYGRIFYICHSAYEELINSLNLEEDYWANDSYVVPITKSEAQYFKPLKYGNTVIVHLMVKELKRHSFELNYDCRSENGEICAVVKTTHVFVDKKGFKKKELSKEIAGGLSLHVIK